MNAASSSGPTPADVAFLAMAHVKVGELDEAAAAPERLRALMTEPPHAADPDARAFLREAEALIEAEANARSASGP